MIVRGCGCCQQKKRPFRYDVSINQKELKITYFKCTLVLNAARVIDLLAKFVKLPNPVDLKTLVACFVSQDQLSQPKRDQ